ncbi:unnamed protein product [Protopolystoma xenopodis]|uniref:Uncharacterized protein n=1 Tax=Protopolystoma xenopodis TaxID=117903 RepID=A0A3S5BIY0_9PLAT|nr:unnamed protein product [Protopolystoma xenopodis]
MARGLLSWYRSSRSRKCEVVGTRAQLLVPVTPARGGAFSLEHSSRELDSEGKRHAADRWEWATAQGGIGKSSLFEHNFLLKWNKWGCGLPTS